MSHKKPKGRPSTPQAPVRFRVVAVHVDVVERLEAWLHEAGWCQAASDFQAMLDLVEEGDLPAAELLFRSQSRDAVGEGVQEYGKKQKGGTLRLFVLREFDSYFFLAVGLKKTNAGAAEISTSRDRAKAIKKIGKKSSLLDYQQALGDRYRVAVIPSPSEKTP